MDELVLVGSGVLNFHKIPPGPIHDRREGRLTSERMFKRFFDDGNMRFAQR